MADQPHLFGSGRVSYIQLPALNTERAAVFYRNVFGWEIRGDGTEHLGFTDATGDMIGAWVTSRSVSGDTGVIPFVYVHGIDDALDRIAAKGGETVKAPYPEGDLWVATFRDPEGNVIGIWQRGPR